MEKLINLTNKFTKQFQGELNKSNKEYKEKVKGLPEDQKKILDSAMNMARKGITPNVNKIIEDIKNCQSK